MHRKESFGGTSQISNYSSFYGEEGEVELLNDNPCVFYLKNKGKLPSLTPQQQMAQPGGKLLSLWNYPLRNKLWPIHFVDFHLASGQFALADSRGQVYHLNWKEKEYESVKLASKPVSAIAFVQGVKHMLIISYENGNTVMMNAKTKEILCNITLPSKATVLFIRSHPRKPVVIFAMGDNSVTIWNLESNQCTQTLECQERVVDIRFEINGDILVLILEKSGVYFYDFYSLQLLGELKGPSDGSQQLLFWTSYLSIPHRYYLEEEDRHQLFLNVLLSGTDNRLYSYYIGIEAQEKLEPSSYQEVVSPTQQRLARGSPSRKASFPSSPSKAVGGSSSATGGLGQKKPSLSQQMIVTTSYSLSIAYFGYFDLPGKFQAVVSSCYLGELSKAPIIGLLTSVGEFLLLKSEGCHEQAPGYLTVIGNVTAEITQIDLDTAKNPPDPEQLLQLQNSQYYSLQPLYGKMSYCHDYVVVIGHDGAARLFAINEMLGSGSNYMGRILKAKRSKTVNKATIGTAETKREAVEDEGEVVDYYEFYLNDEKGLLPAETTAAVSTTTTEPGLATASDSFRHTKKSHAQMKALKDKSLKQRVAKEFRDHRSFEKQQVYDELLQVAQRDKRTSMRLRSQPSKSRASSSTTTTSTTRRTNAVMRSPNLYYSKLARPSETATSGSTVNTTRSTIHSFITGNKSKKETTTTTTNTSNSKLSQVTIASTMPLFELATLTPKEKRVNYIKLKAFLSKHDLYPSRYRPLIWRFLLKLPENSVAFSHLVQRGIHPAFEHLYEQYPIPSQKLFTRLQNLCSQLAHWSPIFSDAPYLPALAFPFTLVYGSDELAALETVMTIMMYWGYSWHATHPNPPAHYLDTFNQLLKLHEISLYQHFQKLQLIPGVYAWQLVSTLFTEICNRSAWLQIMDYLFTYFKNICNVLLLPIAIMKDLKAVLLSCDSMNKVATIFHHQQVLNVHAIITQVQEMLKMTPEKHFVSVATKYYSDKSFQLNGDQPVEQLNFLEEVDEAKENLALANGVPKFPLLKGNYPAYDGYPETIINLQIQERNKITMLSKEIRSREHILKTLVKRIEEIDKSHEQWKQKHQTSTELEMKYHQSLLEKEKKYLNDLLAIEEEISNTKIKTLDMLEETMKQEMNMMDETYRQQEFYLQENEKLLREKLEMNYTLQKQRELSEKIESTSQEKLRQLRMKRNREDWLKSVASLLKNREQALLTEDLLLQEKWKQQDDERRLLREQREQSLLEREELEKFELMQEEIDRRMKTLQVERQQKLLEIERARAIRIAKEQADDALEAAERSALLLKKQELLETATATTATTKGNRDLQANLSALNFESQKLFDQEQIQAIKAAASRQALRKAQFQQTLAAQQRRSEEQSEASQELLQRQTDRLKRQVNSRVTTSTTTSSNSRLRPSRSFLTQEEDEEDDDNHEPEIMITTTRRGSGSSKKVNFAGPSSTVSASHHSSSNDNQPVWMKAPTNIPAPVTDIGLGYGYGVKEPATTAASRSNKPPPPPPSTAPQFKPAHPINNTSNNRNNTERVRPPPPPAATTNPVVVASLDESESVHPFSVTEDLLWRELDDDPTTSSYPLSNHNDLRLPIDEAMELASRRLLAEENHELLEEEELDDVPTIPPTWTKHTSQSTTATNYVPVVKKATAMSMSSSSQKDLEAMWRDSNSPKKLLMPRKASSSSSSFLLRENERSTTTSTTTSNNNTASNNPTTSNTVKRPPSGERSETHQTTATSHTDNNNNTNNNTNTSSKGPQTVQELYRSEENSDSLEEDEEAEFAGMFAKIEKESEQIEQGKLEDLEDSSDFSDVDLKMTLGKGI